MMKTTVSALAISVFAAMPVHALDPSDAVEAEVLQGWKLPDGRRVAALKLTLAEGWKTYWRAPGGLGIPPRFDWSGARNIENLQVTWPQPIVFHEEAGRSIGYKDQVVIPLHIAAKRDSKPITLKGRMDIGICADICVPYSIDFDTILEAAGAVPVPAIASAMASAPFTATEAGVSAATCRVTPTEDGMQIEARVTMPSAGAQEEAVIEAGQDAIWVSEPKTRRQGNEIIAVSEMYHANGSAFSINRSDVRITIFGSNHSVDIRGCTAA